MTNNHSSESHAIAGSASTNIMIFTDLDGTLLNHHDYSFTPALPVLQAIKRHNIPLIPATSKTFAELIELRRKIGLDGPFIIENGAAVCIPDNYLPNIPDTCVKKGEYWFKEFVTGRDYWIQALTQIAPQYPNQFLQFSKMSITQICEATGLDECSAELAAQRQYGEPILWTGSDSQKQAFIKDLIARDITVQEGGRFIHLSGDANKGDALRWFLAEYQTQFSQKPCLSIALGDGKNDIAMLEAADISVRILSPCNHPPTLTKQKNVMTSTEPGPLGWSQCLREIFKQYAPEVL
ncbi:MAG: mannosyl-3-phosphoglycerate phosphatase [Alteromonadaceae bacterium]|nr:MAG: mannosyl-3-phosphoglycerate phosphatase [Alteromonadaceae bacterium]